LTIVLNELDPLECDKSGLNDNRTEDERADKIINDAFKLGRPKFIISKDIVTGNDHLNLLFCEEIFSRINGLEPMQKYNENEKKNLVRIINYKLKDDNEVADVIPINPEKEALFEVMKDGIILK